MPVILILRPMEWFSMTGAELRRVESLGQYMTTRGAIRSEEVDAQQRDLRELASLCEELRPDSLYARYANKKVFRHKEDFWATTEKIVRQHVKRMADMRVVKAVELANKLDIPLLYAADKKSALHYSDRLSAAGETGHEPVIPVMNFRRHDDGITYCLQLRIDGRLADRLSERRLIVLTYEPGMFALDGSIHKLDDGFSGQLLLPFVRKRQVEIPRRMENDYFHRFILRHVARAEINAEGFDITDVSQQPRGFLKVENAIDGSCVVSLLFRYGSMEYAPDSKRNGRVTLTAADNGFRFIRQLRDPSAERRLTELLRQTTGAGATVRFKSLGEMIDWLRKHAPGLKALGFEVVQPSNHVYNIAPLSVEQSDTWHGDWLQTDVTVVIDGGRLRIPFLDLRDTILRGEQEYMLPTGERLLIPGEWLTRYGDLLLIGMAKGKGFQRHRSQIGSEELKMKDEESFNGAPSAHGIAAANSSFLTLHSSLKTTLRPYQLTGLQWLWQNLAAQTGCCLSDDMGLGKTLQTIALLLLYKEAAKAARAARQPSPGMLFSEEEMRGDGETDAWGGGVFHLPYRTSLVVAPASVVHNWRNEVTRFAPSLSVLTYTGDISKRESKRLALMQCDVVLTTYRTLLNDIDQLAHYGFGIAVFDESQAFKTATSQIHAAVARIQALHRLALSGTPVENDLQELWSLMSVLNPNLLGDARSFQNSFVNPIAQQMAESRRELLRRLIAPYFLRRTKEEVVSDLPDRQDEVVVCAMTDGQARAYAEELSKARNEWMSAQEGGTPDNQRNIHILAALQRLRQIANGEGKLAVVFDYLENLRQTRHKVLLFSEYVTLLEQVGQEMSDRGWTYALLTGQTRNREQVTDRFQQSADCQFFLISLKAGGVGLNLTAADYVFLLDPWWNRAAEEQAIARAHRIGQQRAVFVYRFVSANTLEEQILTLQNRKQSLIDSVMPFVCK